MGLVYTILNLFLPAISGFNLFLDWISRLDINDSFFNSFNFFWTTFLYLPSFFFAIFLGYIIYKSIRVTNILYVHVLMVFWLYNVEINDFLIVNTTLSQDNINYTNLNLLLTNNLNKYHPFIFYTSVWMLFSSITIQNVLIRRLSRFQTNEYIFNLMLTVKLTLVINLLALFLGSWWALQEGTWGGWWNWDPSEVLGLLFTFGSLWHLHSHHFYYNTSLAHLKLVLVLICTVFSYLFIQLNFDLVSHNFGSKFFFFFNHNLFFFEVIFFTILIIIRSLYLYSVISNTTLTLQPSHSSKNSGVFSIKWLLLSIWNFMIFLAVWISFTPLLNYFIWVYFNINSFNTLLNIQQLIIFSAICLMYPFMEMRYQRIDYLWKGSCILLFTHGLVFAPLLFLKRTWISVTHTLLLLLFFTNFLTYTTQFMTWLTISEYNDFLIDDEFITSDTGSWICNGPFLENTHTLQTNSGFNLNTWNVVYETNSLSLNSFYLLFNVSTYLNLYNLSSNWLISFLYIETNYINNLLDSVLLIIFIVWLWYTSVKRQSSLHIF